MLDIYDADGHLDRGRVLDELNESLRGYLRTCGATGTKGKAARKAAYDHLVNLLDECSEGFTANPLDAPSMTTDYINACKRVRGTSPVLNARSDRPMSRTGEF